MSDDLERLMRRASPRVSPPELRSRVLAAVGRELETSRQSRRWRRVSHPGSVVAAALLAGVGLNFWAMTETDRRMASLLGSPSRDRPATEIAAVNDPTKSAQSGGDAFRNYAADLRWMIRRLTTNIEDIDDETPAKVPQMGRPDRGHGSRHLPDRQRLVCLEYRFRACGQA